MDLIFSFSEHSKTTPVTEQGMYTSLLLLYLFILILLSFLPQQKMHEQITCHLEVYSSCV